MSAKGAALFGIIAMLLWTIRMTIGLAKGISGVAGGFLPLNTLMGSMVDFLAALSLLIFFLVYYRSKA